MKSRSELKRLETQNPGYLIQEIERLNRVLKFAIDAMKSINGAAGGALTALENINPLDRRSPVVAIPDQNGALQRVELDP